MGRRYRLYPTEEQDKVLTKWGHTVRALWNVALEQRNYLWKQRRHTMRAIEQCKRLTAGRAELTWLAELPAQAAQQVLRRLDRAYDNYWNPEHPAGFPQLKKRANRVAVPLPGQSVEVRKLNRHWGEVKLPKLGWVRFRLSRPLGGNIRNATVSRDGLGWHVSFGVATGWTAAPPNGKPGCGIDFGVAASAYVSTEAAPRVKPDGLTKAEKNRLRALEQRKARQITYAKKHADGRYSNRLRATIAAIGKLRTREANRRQDFTHKLTTDLAKNHGFVGIEDLRVVSMTASAKGSAGQPGKNVAQKSGLNRAILDNCAGERRRQLAYKCPQYGSQLIAVPAAVPHRPAPPAARSTLSPVWDAADCSPARAADTRTTPTTTPRSRSRPEPAGRAARSPTARAGTPRCRVPPACGGERVKPSRLPPGSPRESLGTNREGIVKTTRSSQPNSRYP